MTYSKPIVLLVMTLAVLMVGSCQSRRVPRNAPVNATTSATVVDAGTEVDFSLVMNRDWILSEFKTGSGTVVLNRDRHVEMGFGNIFTLRFDDALAIGTAMPNTFRGPYTPGENRAITFGPMATTRMASFVEPEELNEDEFFAMMNNVVGWNLVGGNLELYTSAEGDVGGAMIFVPLEN